ncbi:MAG: VCBS repeat-containing protein [Phycisphaerales bacterium]|nr:VCBS repeat-containing protein [Phycisphaerales bacterium]
MPSLNTIATSALSSAMLLSTTLAAQDERLSDYFGFQGHDVIKIGNDPGPMLAADLNGDGLEDLLVINNHDSRIDVLYQKSNPDPSDVKAPTRTNELPDHWRYRRESIPLADQANGLRALDIEGDGDLDLIYAGRGRIVVLEQESPEIFTRSRTHTVQKLEATQNAFTLANVIGNSGHDLLSVVNGNVTIWPLKGDDLGQPLTLSAGKPVRAIIPADYDGDGLMDIAGIVPDDSSPVRIWFGRARGDEVDMGAQVIFEMPPITVFEAVELPGVAAARIAVVERASKRVVLYELSIDDIDDSGNREASFVVHAFDDPGNRNRTQIVTDLDGDGLSDLVATNTEANELVVYRQIAGDGLDPGTSSPTLTEVKYLAAEDVTPGSTADLFVLSEEEGVVGRSSIDDDHVAFPKPMAISEGYNPVAMNVVTLESGPRLAVVSNEKRDYLIELIDMQGNREAIELGSMSRAPDTIMAVDADQDEHTDLLLFTRDKPMIMLHAVGEQENEDDATFVKMEKDDMGQFGLVAKAASDNTTVFDIDGDGQQELLVADSNHVRAVRYEAEPTDGSSPGWQVVTQFNANDPNTKLVALTTLENRIIVADEENNRLVIFTADESGTWSETESLTVRGFPLGAIAGGQFTGDDTDSILAFGDEGFAVIRLEGQRRSLAEVDSWRTDEERRQYYQLVSGDLNADGYIDMVSLDAGEQMFELFTFDHGGQMLHVTNFKIYETRLFSRGEGREYQPSQVMITDLTGDGAHDVVMLIHDRVLVYVQ